MMHGAMFLPLAWALAYATCDQLYLLLQVTINTTSTAGGGSSSRRFNGSALPPGSYCNWNEQNRVLSCGIDVTYCCLGSYNLSSGIPRDWKQRLVVDQRAADPNSSAVAAGNATIPAAAVVNSSSNASNSSVTESGRQNTNTKAYTVVLAVALPLLALLFATGIFGMLRWTRREVSRRSSSVQGSAASGGGSVTGLLDTNSPSSLPASSGSSGKPALLQSGGMAAARLLAPAGQNGDASSSSNMQPLLDSAASGASCALSPFAQPSWQQQLETQQQVDAATATAAAAAAAAHNRAMAGPFAGGSSSHGQSLVSLCLLRGCTMPADLLARAVDQFHEAQQLQGHDDTAGSAAAAAGGSSSWRPEPPDPPLKR